MAPRKIKVVDVINDTTELPCPSEDWHEPTKQDIKPTPLEQDIQPIEDIQPTPLEQDIQPIPTEQVAEDTQPKPVSNIKTVELVECPDCGKNMTAKTLKYSHAKNCTVNKQPTKLEAVQEQEQEQEQEQKQEEEEEEEETKIEEVKPPPKLKRSVSVKMEKTVQPVKKTINKVKQDQPIPERVEITPTVTNLYGREHRNERVKQKTIKMNTLFVNAI